MNWDLPQDRYELITRVGPEEYNRLHAEHLKASVIKTVNGYHLRYVQTRFGRLVQVLDTTMAFVHLDAAEKYAESQPEGKAVALESG